MAKITRIHPDKQPISRGGVTIEFENEAEYQGFMRLLNHSDLVVNVSREYEYISEDENKALERLLSDIRVSIDSKE